MPSKGSGGGAAGATGRGGGRATQAEPRAFAAGDAASMNDWGRENYGAWAGGLASYEKTAIRQYQANDYIKINRTLREGTLLSATGVIPDQVQAITAALDRAVVPEAVIAYRGLSSKFKAKDVAVGQLFTDHGFMSTSLNVESSEQLSSGMMLRIKVPKGTKGAYLDSFFRNLGEHELLIQRGSSFRIGKTTIIDGVPHIDLTLKSQR